jgi:hypothetical protein
VGSSPAGRAISSEGPLLLARLLPVVALVALVCGCAAPTPSPAQPSGPASATTCREAFRLWVGGAASLNSPGTDVGATIVDLESVQRRVFELCGLDEAEQLNRELQIEYVPGTRQSMIEPDMRTFADVECVDESPLLDGTRLCAEVGH